MILNKIMALKMIILADAAAFLDTGIKWGSALVSVGGAVLLVSGLTDYSEGKTQHNPNAKMEGLTKIVGGIAVILIGVGLVPQIRNMFPE
ncbi:MAG: hypothetical protein HDR19_01940 [Lachnospiraceae bacterium]|nr:hypothetical protein [Lachnospiraceae bacterium]